MSSRRKSRPVRRLKTPSDPVLNGSDQRNEQSHIDNGYLDNHISLLENRKTFENLPEGVCIVHPRSASDDRGQEVITPPIKAGDSFDEDEITLSFKHRLRHSISTPIRNERNRRDGTDLNLKRRRLNGDDDLASDEISADELSDHSNTVRSALSQFTNGKSETNLANFVYSKEDASQFRDSSSSFPPSVAAMVASIVSSNDMAANSSIKKEVLQQIFSKIPPGGMQANSSSASTSELCANNSETAVDSITAGTVSSGVGLIKKGTLDPANFDEEVFDQYITKYTVRSPCLQNCCPHTTRDHYHCTDSDCSFQRFTNKADVIRHYNMHKKRDNALVHGFMRFAPNDSCISQFGQCHLNGTSTHYHCLHSNCTKVYTSTSDVLAHENFHKRNLNLVAIGFRRFPDTVSCGVEFCPYGDERTTHFHCARNDCNFAFKHESEMDKHKAYHNRDDAYTRQGFKKFYKKESCQSSSCPWSRSANHYHCLRHECNFAFTSTNQMVAHKREHDRQNLDNLGKPAPTMVILDRNSLKNFDSSSFCEPYVKAKPSTLERQDNDALSANAGRSLAKTEPTSLEAVFSHLSKSGASDNRLISSRKKDSAPFLTSEPKDFIKYPSQNKANHESSPFYENGVTYRGNQDASGWNVKRESSDNAPHNINELVLNLSGRNIESDDVINNNDTETNQLSSASPFKYFRSCPPGQCNVPSCIFTDQTHHHCVIDGCCAVFTEEKFVANHSLFHEKLDQRGIEQVPSHLFPRQFLESLTPPPGFITLSKINKLKNLLSTSETPNKLFHHDPLNSASDLNQEIHKDEKNDVITIPPVDSNQFTMKEYLKRSFSNNPSFLCGLDQKIEPVSSNLASTPKHNESECKQHETNSASGDSYIHIKEGTSCMREDCKYMKQSHWHCTLNRCRYICKSVGKAKSHIQAHDSLEAYARAAKDCFKSYTVKKHCPNPNCEFRLRGHYHCLKPGCQFVTIGTSKLPWHMKKHEKIAKREASGFKYYMKKEDCTRPGCKYSGYFSHYHCVRVGCSFAFQYKHQMSTHVRKHMRRLQGKSYNGTEDDSLSLHVDKSGAFDLEPGKMMERDLQQQEVATSVSPNLIHQQMVLLEHLSRGFKRPNTTTNIPASGHHALLSTTDNDIEPLSGADSPECDDESSCDLVLDLSTSNVDSDSNGAVSPQDADDKFNSCEIENFEAEESNYNRLVESENKGLEFPTTPNATPSTPGRMFTKFRISNDVMEGFRRFEISEGCDDEQCLYSTKASHYHCLHEDCHYRFTGRSHMFTHHQHHQRVANLVRDDFRRIKSEQDCKVDGCKFENTHFHCLRCEFVCSDSSRVVPHRRHHMKVDTWAQSGFERYLGKEDCGREDCKYRHRTTTHYHCIQHGCFYTVLGLSGIEQHHNKHLQAIHRQPKPQVSFSFVTRQLSIPDESSPTSSNVESSSASTYAVPFAALVSASSDDLPSDKVQLGCSSVSNSQRNKNIPEAIASAQEM